MGRGRPIAGFGPLTLPLSPRAERVAEGRARGASPHRSGNFLQNTLNYCIGFVQDFVVPEAQDPVSSQGKLPGSPAIGFHLQSVLSPVKLHDQSNLRTAEIHDVVADWVLSPEFRSTYLPVPQSCPEHTLGIGLRSPKLSRPSFPDLIWRPRLHVFLGPLTLPLSPRAGRGFHRSGSLHYRRP